MTSDKAQLRGLDLKLSLDVGASLTRRLMVLHAVCAESPLEEVDDAAMLELTSRLSVRVKSRKPDISELHRYSRRAPAWKGIPSWFLLAEDDRMIVTKTQRHKTQRHMAERMKAKIKAHAVDHTPSVTAPAAVVDVIRSVTGN